MSDRPERFLLLADRGCPFAHRVRALLAHLEIAYELVEAAPGTHPPELVRWSPTKRIPLLVQNDTSIGESRVMLDLIAETHGFDDAYPASAIERALHREAMAIVDEKLAPALFLDRPIRQARLAEYLDRLTQVARLTPPAPCLLSFHVAPIWLRLQWWHPEAQVTKAIHDRSALAEWLDALVRLPAVVATSPDRADSIEDFNAVRALAATA